MKKIDIQFRSELKESDISTVRRIVESTGFFSAEENDIAVELVEERLLKGDASGYFFEFAEIDNETVGYVCYGPIAGSIGSYDLYWIAILSQSQGHGFGKILMRRTESIISQQRGRKIYVDTSSRDQYIPTRKFYLKCGYVEEAILKDFYSPGNSKVIFVKTLIQGE